MTMIAAVQVTSNVRKRSFTGEARFGCVSQGTCGYSPHKSLQGHFARETQSAQNPCDLYIDLRGKAEISRSKQAIQAMYHTCRKESTA